MAQKRPEDVLVRLRQMTRLISRDRWDLVLHPETYDVGRLVYADLEAAGNALIAARDKIEEYRFAQAKAPGQYVSEEDWW